MTSSPTPPPVDPALVDEAVALTRMAGEATLRWFRDTSLTVDRKVDGTPVTQADREAERLIRAELASRHPSGGVLGEEEPETIQDQARTNDYDNFLLGYTRHYLPARADTNDEIFKRILHAARTGEGGWSPAVMSARQWGLRPLARCHIGADRIGPLGQVGIEACWWGGRGCGRYQGGVSLCGAGWWCRR